MGWSTSSCSASERPRMDACCSLGLKLFFYLGNGYQSAWGIMNTTMVESCPTLWNPKLAVIPELAVILPDLFQGLGIDLLLQVSGSSWTTWGRRPVHILQSWKEEGRVWLGPGEPVAPAFPTLSVCAQTLTLGEEHCV